MNVQGRTFNIFKAGNYVVEKTNAAISWRLNYLKRFLRHLWIQQQVQKRKKGKLDERYAGIRAFKDKYKDERCFIVCTGPSLTIQDVDKLKDEITFSMNSIFMLFDQTTWRPSYYCIIDPCGYELWQTSERFRAISNMLIPDILINRYKPTFFNKYIEFPLDDYELFRSKTRGKPIRFSDDAYSVVYDVATVTYTLIQLAVYMGFKKIYLLGCDCDYGGEQKHFMDHSMGENNIIIDNAENNIIISNTENNMILAYQAAQKYADIHGIKILNATRGGKLKVFPKVNFDDLFEHKD